MFFWQKGLAARHCLGVANDPQAGTITVPLNGSMYGSICPDIPQLAQTVLPNQLWEAGRFMYLFEVILSTTAVICRV
jgi:hypothetical protein